MGAKTKSKVKLTKYDSANFLTTKDAMRHYLDEALATHDPALIVVAFGTVARAQGMAKLAKQSGLSRESLYKSLGETGNPEFATVVRIVHALGLRFSLEAA